MIAFDPSKRITAQQALEHPYFKDLNRSKLSALMEQPQQGSSMRR